MGYLAVRCGNESTYKMDYVLADLRYVMIHLLIVLQSAVIDVLFIIQVEQPHVNILSKVDLIEEYTKLPFNLDFFTEVLDLSYLLQHFSVRARVSFLYFKLTVVFYSPLYFYRAALYAGRSFL